MWENYFQHIKQLKVIAFYTLYSINCVLRDQERKGNGLGPECQFSKNYFEESISYLNIMKSEDFWKLLISKEFQEETGQDCWVFYFLKSVSQ